MPMIGARIRELRQNRGLTLEQVANETTLSVSFLSMLERDKVSVSVDNLERLARFFGVRLVHFFEGLDEGEVIVTRRAQIENRTASVTAKQAAFVMLTPRADARMEPLLIQIGPGHGDPRFRSHEGDTLIYVVAGAVRLIAERGETVELQTGDSGYYFGFPARRIENASASEPATILLVATPPTSMRDDVVDSQHGVLIQSEES